jgi:hypothetical protein
MIPGGRRKKLDESGNELVNAEEGGVWGVSAGRPDTPTDWPLDSVG